MQASKVVVLERMDELEQSVEEIRTALAILTAGLAGLETRLLGAVIKIRHFSQFCLDLDDLCTKGGYFVFLWRVGT